MTNELVPNEQEIINSARVLALAMKVEEAARSTDEGVKHFIEPARGTLQRATSKRQWSGPQV